MKIRRFQNVSGLAHWEAQPFRPPLSQGPSARDLALVSHRLLAIEAPGPPDPDGSFARASAAILSYRAFPGWLVQRHLRREPLALGDTVEIFFPGWPLPALAFGARVTAVIKEQDARGCRSGFTYRTLAGHPENGEETFLVEKDAGTGRVTASLQSWSHPGSGLAVAFLPFVRALQIFAMRMALRNLARLAQRGETR